MTSVCWNEIESLVHRQFVDLNMYVYVFVGQESTQRELKQVVNNWKAIPHNVHVRQIWLSVVVRGWDAASGVATKCQKPDSNSNVCAGCLRCFAQPLLIHQHSV